MFSRKPGAAGATGGGSAAGATGGGSAAAAARTAAATAPLKIFDRIGEIVESKAAVPTIVNPASNFVVVTYWWGRGNLNRNFARPCTAFYENLLIKPVYLIKSAVKLSAEDLRGEIDWPAVLLNPRLNLVEFYNKQVENYMSERGIRKTAADHSIQFRHYFESIIQIVSRAFRSPKIDAFLKQMLLAKVSYDVAVAEQESLLAALGSSNVAPRAEIIQSLKDMKRAIEEKTNLSLEAIKTELRFHIFGPSMDPAIIPVDQRDNYRPFLKEILEHKPPILFEDMIAEWEQKCRDVNCNYMAVEYPEFVGGAGYQLAINAKPMFIRKALELCAPRAVLYIDGDMTVNRYPHIFDLHDIDYMARGWGIDPRASWKYETGDIHVDPYVFETSGGIMYFSQTPEAHKLLDAWIYYSSLPNEKGKADDRIISLFFNTKGLLAPMKIIQLPVEYLWLTLDYDYTIPTVRREEIYVEHPQCLTSEDTAASGGAASSRHPSLYPILEQFSYKRSEMLYESVLFPTKEIADCFRPYLNYLRDAFYQAEFLDEDSAELDGEQPFYVVPFGHFGNKQAIYEANIAKARTSRDVYLRFTTSWNDEKTYANVCFLNRHQFTVPNILQQLALGRTILYQPGDDSDPSFKIIDAIFKDPSKSRLELVFFEKRKEVSLANHLNFQIDLDKAMLIRSGGRSELNVAKMGNYNKALLFDQIFKERLPPLFTMFALMEDITELERVFANNYQFLSLIRCHAATMTPMKAKAATAITVVPTKKSWFGKKTRRSQHGGDRSSNNSELAPGTNDALELMYGPINMVGGGRRRATTRRRGGRRSRRRA